jgi:DNA-binding NarL/FixJ family response regulator
LSESTVIRVFIVEDHPVLRLGLRHVLEHEGIQLCGEAGSIDEAIQGIEEVTSDLVMIDLSLGGEDGIELVQQLIKKNPAYLILVYSAFEDATHIERALRAGAIAYVTKAETHDLLGHAIRECIAERGYLSPKSKRSLLNSPYVRELLSTLSIQEQQVYKLLSQGVSTIEMASRLDLSPRTVESYFARIQIKLGLSGMKELRKQAVAKPI